MYGEMEVLFRLGPLSVTPYSLMMGLAFLLALAVTFLTARRVFSAERIVTMVCLGTVAAILVGRHHYAQQQDVAGMRLRRATKMARKRLKTAAAFLNSGDDNRFYEEIYKAIWGCLADKYNIQLSRLSSDTVRDCLSEKNVPEEQQTRILQTLQKVDFARFAPGDAASKKQEIYDEALQMIVMI